MLHYWLLLILALIGVLPVQAQNASDTANFRFMHLAPSLAQVTVSVNDDTFSALLDYTNTTDWTSITAGTLNVSLDDTPLESLDVQPDEWLTLIITTDAQGNPTLNTIREDTTPPPAQETRLTLYYGVIGGLPEIDVLLDEMLLTRGLVNGQSLTVNVVANTYRVQLTNPDSPTERLIAVNGLALAKETVYLLVIYGEADAPQSQLIVSDAPVPQTPTSQPTDTPTPQPQGTAALRFAHLSSGTPPIDIYLNGEKGNTRILRFPDFSGWTSLPAGLYRVGVTLADTPLSEALIAPIDIEFQAGTFTNVMLIGALANNTLTLHLLEENYAELRQGAARLSVLNAHPGVGSINVTLENGVELVKQLGYPGYFGSNDGLANLIVDAGTYDLIVSADNNGDVLFELPNRSLLSGRSYFITVISADPPFFLTFSDIRETEALLAEDE